MKKIYSFILVVIALFAIQSVAKAQPYTEKNHIAYSKTVTGPVDGVYTIHLDTFVTGEVTVTTTNLPADVVLVLDVSGSMDYDYGTTVSYTARQSMGYTYNNSNTTYYYLHTDGNYYPVTRGRQWVGISRVRYLRVDLPNGTYYLSGTGLTGTLPTNVTSDTGTIWTGVLYNRVERDLSRLDALKDAVEEFVKVIKKNADDNNVDNQIAIVKFASNQYYGSETSLAEGNHRGANNNNSYNYTEVVKQFTSVKDHDQELIQAVNALNAGGATAADFGMRKAELLLKDLNTNYPTRQSNKTVVLFTDGDPTYASAFQTAVADSTISRSNKIKHIKAYTDEDGNNVFTTVFTVGVFTSINANERTYMNNTSSNYPDATSMTVSGEGSDKGFFQNAAEEDLSSIFRSIASSAGGSEATQVTATSATTVDIISQSFQLPEGATGDINVYFANCTGVDENGYLTFDEENKIDNPPAPEEGEEDNGHVTITVEGDKITATGFDYSGNWCGKDESLGENEYHGMKLMIEIPIEMAPDAVGGTNVGTNDANSGIYVDGVNICPFDIPHINLPTNLHIKKENIAAGECATFEIYRKKLDVANWETTPFKTVIVIGGNNDNTVKLMGLDPTYLYKIVEAGWSWSYDLDHVEDFEGNEIVGDVTSDKLITNPFIFVNSKKVTKVRHAESAVYNDFRTLGNVIGVDAVGQNKKATETESGEGE